MNRYKFILFFTCTLSLFFGLKIQGESQKYYRLRSKVTEYFNGGKLATAHHESGHALVLLKKDCGTVLLSICLQHEKKSLGHVSSSMVKNKTREQKINTIMMLLAGGISEQLLKRKPFGSVQDAFWDLLDGATLASDDLCKARQIVKELLEGTHDSSRIICLTFKEEEDELLKKYYYETLTFLRAHQNDIRRLVEALLQRPFLTADEVEGIVNFRSTSFKN
ncbi:hypothetical protein KBC04_05415 [Candidatus Babeliales bacterium]|nr:hypothetical protein [Candidatus Babeliales bacterium]MBP9844366.1 hypothetical protein [Candidatus Babeliales bacterium]